MFSESVLSIYRFSVALLHHALKKTGLRKNPPLTTSRSAPSQIRL